MTTDAPSNGELPASDPDNPLQQLDRQTIRVINQLIDARFYELDSTDARMLAEARTILIHQLPQWSPAQIDQAILRWIGFNDSMIGY